LTWLLAWLVVGGCGDVVGYGDDCGGVGVGCSSCWLCWLLMGVVCLVVVVVVCGSEPT